MMCEICSAPSQPSRLPGCGSDGPTTRTPVTVPSPDQFRDALGTALIHFQRVRKGDLLANVEPRVRERGYVVCARFVLDTTRSERGGQLEDELKTPFDALREQLAGVGGELHYWGGNNYFDIQLPAQPPPGPPREYAPATAHLEWDERYRHLLEAASWDYLRDTVYRFADLAELFADRCVEHGVSSVLIPSVGLCVHPWLFADRSFAVTATDISDTALAVVCYPEGWPRLLSRDAYERWDLENCDMYASFRQPHRFARMPDLGSPEVCQLLRGRITFVRSDWTAVPMPGGGVDAIFATNALPRDSDELRTRVLAEWARVVRPGGLVFLAQHNTPDWSIEAYFQGHGWEVANILGGPPVSAGATRFQVWYSSG